MLVLSASLLVQARRTAGLSQRDLAARAGVAQQEIARYERGRVTPSLERLRSLIAACGLELTVGLARADDSYDHQIAAALALAPSARLISAVRDAQPLRVARAQHAGTPAPRPVDVLGVLRALQQAEVQYVLVGEVAEVLGGSPLLPVSGSLEIVARAGQRERVDAAIAAAGGNAAMPLAVATVAIDSPATFTLEIAGTDLVVDPAPPGTHGYDDLRRDATTVVLDVDLDATVASLVDLVRIAEAGKGRARLPALRRTLELTTAQAARAA